MYKLASILQELMGDPKPLSEMSAGKDFVENKVKVASYALQITDKFNELYGKTDDAFANLNQLISPTESDFKYNQFQLIIPMKTAEPPKISEITMELDVMISRLMRSRLLSLSAGNYKSVTIRTQRPTLNVHTDFDGCRGQWFIFVVAADFFKLNTEA